MGRKPKLTVGVNEPQDDEVSPPPAFEMPKGECHLAKLPDDLLVHTISYIRVFPRLAQISRHWSRLVHVPTVARAACFNVGLVPDMRRPDGTTVKPAEIDWLQLYCDEELSARWRRCEAINRQRLSTSTPIPDDISVISGGPRSPTSPHTPDISARVPPLPLFRDSGSVPKSLFRLTDNVVAAVQGTRVTILCVRLEMKSGSVVFELNTAEPVCHISVLREGGYQQPNSITGPPATDLPDLGTVVLHSPTSVELWTMPLTFGPRAPRSGITREMFSAARCIGRLSLFPAVHAVLEHHYGSAATAEELITNFVPVHVVGNRELQRLVVVLGDLTTSTLLVAICEVVIAPIPTGAMPSDGPENEISVFPKDIIETPCQVNLADIAAGCDTAAFHFFSDIVSVDASATVMGFIDHKHMCHVYSLLSQRWTTAPIIPYDELTGTFYTRAGNPGAQIDVCGDVVVAVIHASENAIQFSQDFKVKIAAYRATHSLSAVEGEGLQVIASLPPQKGVLRVGTDGKRLILSTVHLVRTLARYKVVVLELGAGGTPKYVSNRGAITNSTPQQLGLASIPSFTDGCMVQHAAGTQTVNITRPHDRHNMVCREGIMAGFKGCGLAIVNSSSACVLTLTDELQYHAPGEHQLETPSTPTTDPHYGAQQQQQQQQFPTDVAAPAHLVSPMDLTDPNGFVPHPEVFYGYTAALRQSWLTALHASGIVLR